MVLKIAIVDDEPMFLNDIQHLAHTYFAERKVITTIDIFQSHRLLLYELGEGAYYDLFLLDIEIRESDVDGMEMAKRIREENKNAIIIFITSHMKYTIDAFKVSAFRYIQKDNLKSELSEALDEALRVFDEQDKSFYMIETITKYIKLYYADIYYIYKVGKYSIIVSTIGEYKVRKSLAHVYKELASQEFIFVERGFIANISHIDRMENEKIYLDNNVILKVSRPQIHLVKEKIAEYWGNLT